MSIGNEKTRIGGPSDVFVEQAVVEIWPGQSECLRLTSFGRVCHGTVMDPMDFVRLVEKRWKMERRKPKFKKIQLAFWESQTSSFFLTKIILQWVRIGSKPFYYKSVNLKQLLTNQLTVWTVRDEPELDAVDGDYGFSSEFASNENVKAPR